MQAQPSSLAGAALNDVCAYPFSARSGFINSPNLLLDDRDYPGAF
jgi:hypothetical protein